MKAIILRQHGSADNFELAEIPIPAIRNGEVRIKIKAVSFNPVDYQIRKGGPEGKQVSSNILGRDLTGIIDEVAEGVTGFKKGDEVMSYVCDLASSGTYTEYICVPVELVAKKPAPYHLSRLRLFPLPGLRMVSSRQNKNHPGKIHIHSWRRRWRWHVCPDVCQTGRDKKHHHHRRQ